MPDYPSKLDLQDRIEPAPRRVRALLAGHIVLDTTRALYVWDGPYFPQFYIPADDVDASVLVDEGRVQTLKRGTMRWYGLRVRDREVPRAVRIYQDGELAGHARVEWDAVDAWFEEDEEIFVHPRNPYRRCDALRSSRHVQVSANGTLLADTFSPVLLFETALPTRYYIPRTDVNWQHLGPSETRTQCPYKGITSGYWSSGGVLDIAWAYDFPLPGCQPIAGLVAFYNEKVDLVVDGKAIERPKAHPAHGARIHDA